MTGMYVRAAALWSAEYPDASAWLEGRRCEPAPAGPPAELLPRRARGRASTLTAMVAEVVARVASGGRADPSSVPLIVGSAYGEMATTVQLLEMMGSGDGTLSPARFQASVHNTAAGAVSIATGNRGFGTCLSAGDATCAAALLEASAWLASASGNGIAPALRGGAMSEQVIVALADEALPPFFAAEERFAALAVGLLLSAQPVEPVLASLGVPLHDSTPVEQGLDESNSGIEPALRGGSMSGSEPFARNPIAPALALLRAVHVARAATVALPGMTGSWRVQVAPCGAGR